MRRILEIVVAASVVIVITTLVAFSVRVLIDMHARVNDHDAALLAMCRVQQQMTQLAAYHGWVME